MGNSPRPLAVADAPELGRSSWIAEPGVPAADQRTRERVLAGATVLVVDDQESNVALLQRMLMQAGVTRVHAATDGRDVVRRCREVRPDVVLLDLHMPHVDGIEALTALREVLGSGTFLPVVVLTADATPAAKERALRAGANDFLTKPLDRVEVLLRLKNLLEVKVLYEQLARHTANLEAELHDRDEQARRHAAARSLQRQRVETALGGDTITALFQPIADLRTGAVAGVEALARFASVPQRPPNEWFAEAADVGLGVELELAAVRTALSGFVALARGLFMSVNVSPETALSPQLAELLADMPGERIVLELTEHTRVDDYGALLIALDDLRNRGIRVAVDDAGAGWAGLAHILRLRPEIIKLDTVLTGRIHADPVRRALAASLVSFARDIGAGLVAEGIECGEELTALRELGIPWGQGYYLARPAPLPAPTVVVPAG